MKELLPPNRDISGCHYLGYERPYFVIMKFRWHAGWQLWYNARNPDAIGASPEKMYSLKWQYIDSATEDDPEVL